MSALDRFHYAEICIKYETGFLPRILFLTVIALFTLEESIKILPYIICMNLSWQEMRRGFVRIIQGYYNSTCIIEYLCWIDFSQFESAQIVPNRLLLSNSFFRMRTRRNLTK